MDTAMVTPRVQSGAAPDWTTLHWDEMKRVFDVDDENLAVTAGRDPITPAGMWPLVDWGEMILLLNEDEGTLTRMEDDLRKS